MKKYSEIEIIHLIKNFEEETLSKNEWTHQAHLIVAIWYCFTYDFDLSLELVRKNIKKLNESFGNQNTDTEGYHETITKFYLLIAFNFIKQHQEKSLAEITNAFIHSEKADKHYPLLFYSKSLLFSVHSRKNWTAPDLKELP